MFRPYYSNSEGSSIYLGSADNRWEYVYGNYGNFTTIYENGTALSSKYLKNGSTLSGALYLGSSSYYVNNNGNGKFNILYEDGTALSNKYQAKGTYFKNGSTVTGALYLGSNSYYVNKNGNGVFYVCEADTCRATTVLSSTGSIGKWSSRKYKENIIYRDTDYWHERLMKIKPCTFDYTDEFLGKNKKNKNNNIGVIAEDL